MLQTQVNYWNYVEQTRHNQAVEAQAQRELAELTRHNLASEAIGFMGYQESRRHAMVTEKQTDASLRFNYANLSESRRTHMANEAIGRANVGVAAESNRIQARNIEYQNTNTQYANRTNRMNAVTNKRNAATNEEKVRQQYWSNLGDLGLGMLGVSKPNYTITETIEKGAKGMKTTTQKRTSTGGK